MILSEAAILQGFNAVPGASGSDATTDWHHKGVSIGNDPRKGSPLKPHTFFQDL